MTTVFDANAILIIIALLVGFAIGWWIFKRVRSSKHVGEAPRRDVVEAPHARPASPPVRHVEEGRPVRAGIDGPEGNSIADQGAAAASDVAGQVLGVPVHSQLPNAEGPPDNLEIMKGVGPRFVTRLHENGITRFDQIAALTDNEVSILDDKLGPFKGRLRRDRVVEQAHYLARGDKDGFEAKFGRLGSGA